MNLSDDLKKIDKTFKETIVKNSFFIMTIMDILNHFNLRLVNIGIIHQKLEEKVGQIKTLITSFFFLDQLY